MEKIKTIIEKEWAEVFKNRLVLFTVAFLPLMLTALPLITLGSMQGLGTADINTADSLPDEFFGELCTGLSEGDCTQLYLLSIYVLLFMILPVMIPVSISAYSIVGEKTTRSLEPLLATPITTMELLAGKIIAAIIPAVLATWLSFAVFLLGAKFMVNDIVFARLLEPLWFLAIFLVGPLLALLGVTVSIIISSRVNDPRVAEQLSGVVVLPIILMVVGQSTGLILLSKDLILLVGAIIALLDVGLLYFSSKAFVRETILTRWK